MCLSMNMFGSIFWINQYNSKSYKCIYILQNNIYVSKSKIK